MFAPNGTSSPNELIYYQTFLSVEN